MVDANSWPDSPGSRSCEAKGCTGVRASPYECCLAHLDETSLQDVLEGLAPGADLDVRGVRFTVELLGRLLDAVRDPDSGMARVGTAGFRAACFAGTARFEKVEFEGKAVFLDVSFCGPASFRGARFLDRAWFEDAQFSGTAIFNGASFSSEAFFGRAHFSSLAWFQDTRFDGNAWFSETHFGGIKISESDPQPQGGDFTGARFTGVTEFQNAWFGGDVLFRRAVFEQDPMISGVQVSGDLDFLQAEFAGSERLGPVAVAGSLQLSRARFGHAVQVEAAARAVICQHTTFTRHASLLLRYALVLLDDVLASEPLTVAAAEPLHPLGQTTPLDETLIGKPPQEARPRLISLAGADCSKLVVTDADLSCCHFAGVLHLDQLRLEGNCQFARPPRGWTLTRRWPPAWRWTRRQIIAEEHAWRATQPAAPGWPAPPSPFSPPRPPLQPERLAVLYRQLRKAQEDAKNEPGSADFYYGEMEMRRHAPTTGTGERILLLLYWLTSGYGLRATRALALLGLLVIITAMLLTAWGLAGPAVHHDVMARLSQAILITLNAIVFRAGGQALSTPGAYIETAARFTGPALLALAIIALRNRVKR